MGDCDWNKEVTHFQFMFLMMLRPASFRKDVTKDPRRSKTDRAFQALAALALLVERETTADLLFTDAELQPQPVQRSSEEAFDAVEIRKGLASEGKACLICHDPMHTYHVQLPIQHLQQDDPVAEPLNMGAILRHKITGQRFSKHPQFDTQAFAMEGDDVGLPPVSPN